MTNRPSAAYVSRRHFLAAGSASAAFSIVPRHVLGGARYVAPSERLRVAGIGAGGQGGGDISAVHAAGAEIVALCDVDEQRAAGTFKRFPRANRYKDFRRMLEKEAKNIDAVIVGTPDHLHAVATMMALRMDKHVYCEKPLTHTIYEARAIATESRKRGVATQMGNQGHATEGARLTNEWIQAGVIGDVHEVQVWTDRAGKRWKQGVGRPTQKSSVPSTLDWNLWLGPAQKRPYHPVYAPTYWRGWWDFGTGALGDMGCHIIDHPVWALKLSHPTSVEARVTIDGATLGEKPNYETYPIASLIYYHFPARGKQPPVLMTWYDGGLMPPTPRELPAGKTLPTSGVLYIGTRGKMYHTAHGGMPQLLPGELHEQAAKVPKSIPRSIGHHREWVAACKAGATGVSNFGYAGPMTETVLLGNLAMRAPGRELKWDGENLKVLNRPELNDFVHREYRPGWSL